MISDIMEGGCGEPVELVKCETVDLEVPATAQIVIEGEVNLDFDSFQMEGHSENCRATMDPWRAGSPW